MHSSLGSQYLALNDDALRVSPENSYLEDKLLCFTRNFACSTYGKCSLSFCTVKNFALHPWVGLLVCGLGCVSFYINHHERSSRPENFLVFSNVRVISWKLDIECFSATRKGGGVVCGAGLQVGVSPGKSQSAGTC